jgi:hypothetical protein
MKWSISDTGGTAGLVQQAQIQQFSEGGVSTPFKEIPPWIFFLIIQKVNEKNLFGLGGSDSFFTSSLICLLLLAFAFHIFPPWRWEVRVIF